MQADKVVAMELLKSPALGTGPGAGITGGTGTVCKTGVVRVGEVVQTQILIDLTGLNSDATEGDIIGVDATTEGCYLAAITSAESGTLYAGSMVCLETPAGGEVDIDVYSAEEATGVTDGAVGDLTETALLAAAADWTVGTTKGFTAFPADGEYLYLTVGTASTPTAGTYTAGKFLITLYGYA